MGQMSGNVEEWTLNPMYSALLTFAAPIAAGYMGRRVLLATDRSPANLFTLSKWQKEFGNLVLAPITAVLALWALDFSQMNLVALPVLGVAYHAIGTGLALVMARLLSMPARQRGVFLMAGMNSNLGLIGGLLCFLLFGETGYALSSFFRVLELPVYYLAGFPAAAAMGNGQRISIRRSLRQIVTDPSLFLPISGVVLGILLSLTGVPRPAWVSNVNSLLIPLSSINIAFAVGVTLRVGAVADHLRPSMAMAALKFALLPAALWSLGRLAGLDQVDGGLPFRVVVLLSFMPVGFTAIVAATLFDLDEDLANALWFTTTVLVLPVLGLLIPILG